MKQCPNGHEVGSEAKFCPICGAEVIDNGTKFCAKCGNKRKGTDKFCSQCGTPFGVSPMSGNNKTPKKSSKKGIVIAAVVCLLMLATGGAAWYFLQKDKYSLEGLAMAAVNYDWIGNFHDGMAVVYKDEKYGFIDKKGNEIIPCKYDYADDSFNEGLACVRKEGKYGYIDTKGNEVIPCKYDYDDAGSFSKGLACVRKEGKYGYIDTKGNEVIPCKYDGADSFSEGLARVEKDRKNGYIDTKGNEIISCKYDYADDGCFSEGLACVRKDGEYGYIDTKGNEIIPCKYDDADSFSEGLARVEKDGIYGFVDKKGNSTFDISNADANDENNEAYSEEDIPKMKEFLEKFYSGNRFYHNEFDALRKEIRKSYLKKNLTTKAMGIIKKRGHYCLKDEDEIGISGDGNPPTIRHIKENTFMACFTFYISPVFGSYQIELTVVKENGAYKIDDIGKCKVI